MFGLHHQASAATPAMFTALGDDTHDRVDGEIVVRSELPRGFSGVLFRNGPGRFRRDGQTKRTVLDGDGVIQRLEIADGVARYARRFVQTPKLVLAAGRHQMPMATHNILMGGNARVGLEDSLTLAKGRLANSNAEQVAKVVRILRELGYEPATPAEARNWLHLKGVSAARF
jgi:carotenoid cleavage dioxygenase-like enzyme